MTLKCRVIRLYQRICKLGVRQVRFYRGMFYTYPYPCARGYGIRGELIGVYDPSVKLEWLVSDIEDRTGLKIE